jgi:hypothetical protein
MSRPTPPTYKTKNWQAYNEALKRRGSLTVWFDPEMIWEAAPTGKRGRQPGYSDAAIQTCLTLKVLFGMALRQTTGFVESLLGLIGLPWSVPDFSTLSRRQKTLDVTIPYRGSQGPLHLLIDSTGIKVEGEGEWNARKHGGPKRRVWRKIHLGVDEETLEIRAVEVTSSNVGDAQMLPELLDQIAPDQEIGTVTADGAYDTRKCHDAIADRGGGRHHTTAQERQTLEANDGGSTGPQRSVADLEVSGPCAVEAMERISPPKPRRDENALRQTPGPTPRGARIRPSGGRIPNPDCRAQRLHRTGHTRHRGRGMSLSGERGSTAINLFVQQSLD